MKFGEKALSVISAIVLGVLNSVIGVGAFHTPLHDAVKNGNFKDIQICLKLHPEWVSEKDCSAVYNSPLFYARNFDTVRYLVEKGADVYARNLFGSTPLHHLVDLCDERVIKLLMEKGADINARNVYNETPLAHLERSIRVITAFYMDAFVPQSVFSAERFYSFRGEEYRLELYKFRDKLISMGATF